MIIDFQEQYVKRGLMKLGMNKKDLEEYDTDKFGDDMIRAFVTSYVSITTMKIQFPIMV